MECLIGEILIALITEDSRFYYEAVKELKGMDIDFVSLKPLDLVPDSIEVVLTSPAERDKINFPSVVSGKDLEYTVAECLKISKGIKNVRSLVIGVDPGRTPGIAVFADGVLVEVEQLRSPEKVLEATQRIIEVYKGKKHVIRVGMGGGVYNKRIIKVLQENLQSKVSIEGVDETATTPSLGEISSSDLKDIIAAVNIAMKKGRMLKQLVDVKPKLGEIKQVQKESRKLNGSITISKELAKKVASGELTLEKAVEKQAEGNGFNRDKNAPYNR